MPPFFVSACLILGVTLFAGLLSARAETVLLQGESFGKRSVVCFFLSNGKTPAGFINSRGKEIRFPKRIRQLRQRLNYQLAHAGKNTVRIRKRLRNTRRQARQFRTKCEALREDMEANPGYPPSPPAYTSSITQFGITWNFNQTVQYGQFANGDYWVVGPVTIESISPAPLNGRHGSVVNPSPGSQGYDSRGDGYNGALAVSLPFTLYPDQSLVSTISNPEQPDCDPGNGADGWYNYKGECGRGKMKTQAVLTAVSKPLPSGSFRPPFVGSTYKPYLNRHDIKWSRLPVLSQHGIPSVPDGNALLRAYERPFVDHLMSWVLQHTHPVDNFCGYGACMASDLSQAALYMLFDTEHREQLVIRLIQSGIDNYGNIRAGGGWPDGGGHPHGRRFQIVLAGFLLGDPDLLSVGTDYPPALRLFGEDFQSFYVEQSHVNKNVGYQGFQIGMPEWRIGFGSENADWESYRLCCSSGYWTGYALAAHVIGLRSHWNHDVFFDYLDRYLAATRPDGPVAGWWSMNPHGFTGTMWNTFRDNYGCTWVMDNPADEQSTGFYQCGAAGVTCGWQTSSCLGCTEVNSCSQYPNGRSRAYDPCKLC